MLLAGLEKQSNIRIMKNQLPKIGLGCWGMSGAYGKADRNESIATIHTAIDMSLNLLDTADVYGQGHNESLIGDAIKGRRQQVILSSKFGFVGDEHGAVQICGRPDYVKAACEKSLQRLQTDYIDIYHMHRVDPLVPVEETVGAMAELLNEGKIRAIALSEASAQTMRRACRVHRVEFLQSEYSLFTKDVEQEVLAVCRELNITLLAFSPLGRGVLTGKLPVDASFGADDYRSSMPRFSAANLQKNNNVVEQLRVIAHEKNVTPGQLALAWLLHQKADVVPLVGMTKRKYLVENVAATKLVLTVDDLARLRQITSDVAGARHNEHNLSFIDRPDSLPGA